jgi:hypothetical protein
MLSNLSQKQVEQALKYLHDPVLTSPPPQELEHLNDAEWFLLDRMLQQLLKERDSQPLQ